MMISLVIIASALFIVKNIIDFSIGKIFRRGHVSAKKLVQPSFRKKKLKLLLEHPASAEISER